MSKLPIVERLEAYRDYSYHETHHESARELFGQAATTITELVSALETIRAMTNVADPESYRWDAEGCLEAVFSTADTALSNTRGDTKNDKG